MISCIPAKTRTKIYKAVTMNHNKRHTRQMKVALKGDDSHHKCVTHDI